MMNHQIPSFPAAEPVDCIDNVYDGSVLITEDSQLLGAVALQTLLSVLRGWFFVLVYKRRVRKS